MPKRKVKSILDIPPEPKTQAGDIAALGRANNAAAAPSFSEPTNDTRADLAEGIVQQFAADSGLRPGDQDVETTFVDLLSDLMHFADREGFEWAELVRRAEGHHDAEVEQDDDDDDAARVHCYGCGRDVVPIEDDGERHCPRLACGSTDLEGAPHRTDEPNDDPIR